MGTFFKINVAIINFLSLGLIKLQLPQKQLISIIDKDPKLLTPSDKELLSFAKTTQLLPKGCELINEIHTKVMCEILELIDDKSDDDFTIEQQTLFYINFVKLICLDTIIQEVEKDVMPHIQYKSIPSIIFMLLQHNNTTFLRTFSMIDRCLSKIINRDYLLPYFDKYHQKGF